MKNLKVAVFFTNYSHYHLARVKAFQSMVKNEWEVIGIEITRDGVDYQWKTDIDDSDLSIFSILGTSKINKVNILKQINKIFSLLNKLNPDVLVIAGYGRFLINISLLWTIIKNKSSIILSDSKEDDAPRQFLTEKIKSLVVNLFDSALVAGNKHKQYLIKLGLPEKAIFMGYDVVDNNTFHPDKIGSLTSPLNQPFFLAINRFIEKKNLPLIISAYASYYQQKKENSWHLVICGDGELRPQLEGLIHQYNLQQFIHLPGFLQQEELLPYFAHARCFIHASTTEQWGLVVNEAMAAGLPVIVSNGCGCFEDLVIEGVNGFGFNAQNQEELTNLMVKMSSEDVNLHQMGQASLNHIKKYSPQYFAEGLKNAINYSLK